MVARSQWSWDLLGRKDGATAVNWLQLTDATTTLDHDLHQARASLERAVSKAWIVGTGGTPPPAIDTNVPLRIQVTPSPGWRLVGRDWLDHPVLHWEASEIQCLCALWKPSSASQPAPPSQSRARIEVWREDIARLWGSSGISGSSLLPVESSEPASQPTQEARPFPNDTALNERVTAY
jgi:hypothetical protein